MIINEIFGSIDGEGITAGKLATFVRVAGCPLRCSYCDTKYAQCGESGTEMSIAEIISAVKGIGNKNITLTGGEPLHNQTEALALVHALVAEGFFVNIETNGAELIDSFLLPNVIVTMDIKAPSSLMSQNMNFSNIKKLRETDVMKIVMCGEDFEWVRKLLQKYRTKAQIFFSPIFGRVEPVELVEFLKELHKDGLNTDNIRVQIQLHKVIWNPNERGV